MATPAQERHQAGQHPYAGQAEAVTPAERLPQVATQQPGRRGADVDAHVEEREAAVAAFVLRTIQVPHHIRDAGLQEPHPDDDEGQRQVEDLQRHIVAHGGTVHQPRRFPLEGHAEVPHAEQHRAHDHGLAEAEIAICHHAADDGHQIHHRTIGGVDAGGHGVVKQEVLREVEDEQRPHPVEAEALPHLGEEQHHEAAWMAEEIPRRHGGRFTHRCNSSGVGWPVHGAVVVDRLVRLPVGLSSRFITPSR